MCNERSSDGTGRYQRKNVESECKETTGALKQVAEWQKQIT